MRITTQKLLAFRLPFRTSQRVPVRANVLARPFSSSMSLLSAAAPVTAPKLKRFFKAVSVGEARSANKVTAIEKGTVSANQPAFEVFLDGKPIKTPLKRPLVLPTKRLAMMVAAEWEMQRKYLETYTMPLTGLAITATDYVADNRETFIDGIMKFIETDTLCHRADEDELVQRQQQLWDPILDWVTRKFDAPLSVTSGLVPVDQLESSVKNIRTAIEKEDIWTLTALNYSTSVAKSIALALAMQYGRVQPGEVYDLSRLEEEHQISNWGLVEGDHDVEMADSETRIRASYALLKSLQTSN